MTPVRTALVLQGGGALGAYELGAARALYKGTHFAPDLIAGVSIGAITAVLLARPKERTPLNALEEFWKEVAVPGLLLPPQLRLYASFLGNPHFFTPRLDYLNWPNWTYFYKTEPLRQTLERLVDLNKLADKTAVPKLLVTATNLEQGQIEPFSSDEGGLSVDHTMASGSLPPAFPMTEIMGKYYWDGGLFDNTPLGAVLDRLDDAPDVERTIYVVNLFPNKASVPDNLSAIMARMTNLPFANKTADDVKMMRRFNDVAQLIDALEKLPRGNPLQDDPAYLAVKRQHYIHIPKIVSISAPELKDQFAGSDFSPKAIAQRAQEGETMTKEALRKG
jgi:predicted acylesterase/phospholipase RssA